MTVEEVPALVIECGSYSTKAGYTSEDTPRSVFSSDVGVVASGDVEMDGSSSSAAPTSDKFFGDSATLSRDFMEIKSPFDPKTGLGRPSNTIQYTIHQYTDLLCSIVEDWDLYEGLWNYAFMDRMRVKPEEFPVLLVEPSQNTAEQRAKQAELAFEKFRSPAVFLAKTGVLSAFAAGRSTGLVVDVGAALTTISPVYDGYVVKKAVKWQPLAGNLLSAQLERQLAEELKIDLTPRHRILRKKPVDEGQPPEFTVRPKQSQHLTASFEQSAIRRVVDDFKECVCAVSDVRFDERTLNMRPQKPYEFPTGYNTLFGPNRFRAAEVLFNPKEFLSVGGGGAAEGLIGLQNLIVDSVSACDVDLRPQLLGNIVLTGGSTLFQNFGERINNELFSILPGVSKFILRIIFYRLRRVKSGFMRLAIRRNVASAAGLADPYSARWEPSISCGCQSKNTKNTELQLLKSVANNQTTCVVF
jgi:actin-related protein